MQQRPLNLATDYNDCHQWWTVHKWAPVPAGMLPTNTGIMVENQGVKICAGWIYLTNSPIAWIEWIISNPESDAIIRSTSLDLLIESLSDVARKAGALGIFSSSNNPKLISRLERHQFQQSPDQGMIHMFRSFR